MALHLLQTDESTLHQVGCEALGFLCRRDFQILAERFGYALACGRKPAQALAEDLDAAAAQVESSMAAMTLEPGLVTVRQLSSNPTGLVAVVECTARMSLGAEILFELIVSMRGNERFVTIEDISLVA